MIKKRKGRNIVKYSAKTKSSTGRYVHMILLCAYFKEQEGSRWKERKKPTARDREREKKIVRLKLCPLGGGSCHVATVV